MRMNGYNTLFPWAWHWTGEPIVGAALRVQKGDREIIRALKDVDGVPVEELEKFVDQFTWLTITRVKAERP